MGGDGDDEDPVLMGRATKENRGASTQEAHPGVHPGCRDLELRASLVGLHQGDSQGPASGNGGLPRTLGAHLPPLGLEQPVTRVREVPLELANQRLDGRIDVSPGLSGGKDHLNLDWNSLGIDRGER